MRAHIVLGAALLTHPVGAWTGCMSFAPKPQKIITKSKRF